MTDKFFEKYKGEFFLLWVTLFWGGTFTLVKGALSDISSMLFIAFRFSIALLLVLIFKWKDVLKNFDKNVLPPFLLGVLLFIAFATQTVGLKFTLATKSGFITGTSVVLIPVIQTVLEKKAPGKASVLGIFLVLIGLLFLATQGNTLSAFLNHLGRDFNIGDFLTLLCAISYAFYVVYLDILSKKYSFWYLLFAQFAVMTLLSFLAAFAFAGFKLETFHIEFSNNLILSLLYVSIFATFITTALQTKYQKLVTPTKAGIIFSLEPVFAAVIAYFALNEKIGNFGYLGSLLIFLGLIISETFEGVLNGKRQ